MSAMPRSAVKDAAVSGKWIRGLHQTFAAPAVIEVVASVGLDFVYLDGEHGNFDGRDLEVHCIAAERCGLTTIARVPDRSSATITRFLDRGVRGIVAPHVETIGQAMAVVDAAYFAPLGNRSFGSGRPEYGQGIGDRPAYLQACNERVSVCLMIESQAGIDLAGEFAALPGIDYLSFGMMDLAQSLGHAGNPGHADVKAAVADATARINRAGKRVREQFMNYVWVNDVLVAGAKQLLGPVK